MTARLRVVGGWVEVGDVLEGEPAPAPRRLAGAADAGELPVFLVRPERPRPAPRPELPSGGGSRIREKRSRGLSIGWAALLFFTAAVFLAGALAGAGAVEAARLLGWL